VLRDQDAKSNTHDNNCQRQGAKTEVIKNIWNTEDYSTKRTNIPAKIRIWGETGNRKSNKQTTHAAPTGIRRKEKKELRYKIKA
jgi:hypothetical protein